jgi:hypothetical protein
MRDDLILSSAYFNISAGKREDAADTLRVLSTLHTHDGEEAALYAVTEASTPGPMGTRARRLVVDVIQDEFSSRFDLAPGARLKAAVDVAHERLFDEFNGHVRVGLTVLIAEGPSLFVVQAPPAQALVLHQGDLHSVRSGARDGSDEEMFSQSLGSPVDPSTSLFRDTMEDGDVFLLCSSWFSQTLSNSDLKASFAFGDAEPISDRLYEAARRHGAREATCIALQAVRYSQTVGAARGSSSFGAAGARGSKSGSGVMDYVDDAIESLAFLAGQVKEELRLGRGSTAVAERDSRNTNASRNEGTEEIPALTLDFDDEDSAQQNLFRSRSSKADELEQVNTFIDQSVPSPKIPPPVEGFADTTVSPEKIYAGGVGQDHQTGRVGTGFGQRRAGGHAPRGASRSSRGNEPRVAGRRADSGSLASKLQTVPPAMWLFSAVGVIVLIAIIWAVSQSGGGSGNGWTGYVTRAHADAVKAQTAAPSAQKQLLHKANKQIRLAVAHGASSSDVGGVRKYVTSVSYTIYKIVPVKQAALSVVATLPAQPQHVGPLQLTGSPPTMYALSPGRERVYRIDVGKTSTTHIAVAYAGLTPQGGGGLRMNNPVRISSFGDELIGVDKSYDLFTSSPSESLQLERLTRPPGKSSITGQTVFDSPSYGVSLYTLDSGLGQIWRYASLGATPTPYLAKANPNLLGKGDTIAIDGNIYVGTTSGKVIEYTNGVRDKFKLPTPLHLSTISQIVLTPGYIFVFDQPTGQIVEIGKRHARYLRTLLLPPSISKGIGQISVPDSGSPIYLSNGSRAIDSIPIKGVPTTPSTKKS